MRKILILLVITLILIMPEYKVFAYAVQNGYTPIKTVDNSNDSLVYFQSGISKGKINDFTGAIADFSKAVSTNENFVLEEVLPKIKAYKVTDVVKRVSCKEKTVLPGDGMKVALMDFGAKKNIAKSLNERGCEVTIYPAYTSAEEIIASNPDGIMLSNGPGDPKDCGPIIEELKKLYATDIPIFAICLGHQLMALANGADTRKMKWGHRGANHPVKDLTTGRVYMSSQNHGYVVADKTVPEDVAEISFINANDASTEGLHYLGKNIFTVQFHPEACPGPQDTAFLFDKFIDMMEVNKDA